MRDQFLSIIKKGLKYVQNQNPLSTYPRHYPSINTREERNGKNASEIKRIKCEINFQSRIKTGSDMHGIKAHIRAISSQKTSKGGGMKMTACEISISNERSISSYV